MDSALLKELFTGWAIVTKNLDRDRIEYDNGRQLSALDLCAKRSVIVSRALRSGPRELSRKFIVARRSRHEKIRC
jgi:hypothetical protein